jgi:hypothetical protein
MSSPSRLRVVAAVVGACAVLLTIGALPYPALADSVSSSGSPTWAFKSAQANSGNVVLANFTSGKVIRVWSYLIQNAGPSNGTWQFYYASGHACASGFGQATPNVTITPNAFNMRSSGSLPLFEGAASADLCGNAAGTGAGPWNVSVEYTVADPPPSTWYPKTAETSTIAATQSGTWNVNASQAGTWNVNCSSGCGSTGGSESSPDVVKLSDSETLVHGVSDRVELAGGLGIFCLALLAGRSFKRGRQSL